MTFLCVCQSCTSVVSPFSPVSMNYQQYHKRYSLCSLYLHLYFFQISNSFIKIRHLTPSSEMRFESLVKFLNLDFILFYLINCQFRVTNSRLFLVFGGGMNPVQIEEEHENSRQKSPWSAVPPIISCYKHYLLQPVGSPD